VTTCHTYAVPIAKPPLSPLEHAVMSILWRRGSATAGDVLDELSRPLANATVRTLLRRLETKGYVRHTVRARSFVYAPKIAETAAASGAVRRLVQRFFGGSTSKLVAGLMDEGLIDPRDLRALSRRLSRVRKRRADD